MRYLFLIFLFMLGCSLSPKNNSTSKLSLNNFDQIKVDSSVNMLTPNLLIPQGKTSNKENLKEEFWFYNDEKSNQIATLTIDKDTKKIIEIISIPGENDSEIKIDYLVKNKFPKSDFEKFELQRCKRHYIPTTVYFIDRKNGLIIKGDKAHNETLNYSRTSSERTAEFIKKLVGCKI